MISFLYSMNMHCPTCSKPIRLPSLTGTSSFLMSFLISLTPASEDVTSWRIKASELIFGHWGRGPHHWERSGFLPLYGVFALFFLLKSIERFHCIGAGAAMGFGDTTGLGCCTGFDCTGLGFDCTGLGADCIGLGFDCTDLGADCIGLGCCGLGCCGLGWSHCSFGNCVSFIIIINNKI